MQAATGALLSLIEACPSLTRLCLTAHRQVLACPSPWVLRLHAKSFFLQTGDRELAALATLPSLEQLDILGNRFYPQSCLGKSIMTFIVTPITFKCHLHIFFLLIFFVSCQSIARNVSLTAVQELVASLPNLKLLDCSFCDQLGEQGVFQLRAQVMSWEHVT